MANLASLLGSSDFSKAFEKEAKNPNGDKIMDTRSRAKQLIKKPQPLVVKKNSEHTFIYNEKIFSLKEKSTLQKSPSEDCFTCMTSFKSLGKDPYKEMHYCDFCQRSNCKKCVTKTRVYNSQVQIISAEYTSTVSKGDARGRICELCSRKFIMLAMLKEKHEMVTDQETNLESLDAVRQGH